MAYPQWMEELRACRLCEWRCGIDRTEDEHGMCRMGPPQVASCTLHPAPPESYTVFMAGCNFACLHCQNYDIAHGVTPPGSDRVPEEIAAEGIRALHSPLGHLMRADRLFFSGGELTCSLPYIERIVAEARRLEPRLKINFDTNGFATTESFERILAMATSITFDLRAIDDELHRAMTGAPVAPVLRNAAALAARTEQLWEYRVLVVPEINDGELESICTFIADLDRTLPVAFLAFRPNFVLEWHPGSKATHLDQAVTIGRDCGLFDVTWHGHSDLSGMVPKHRLDTYKNPGAQIAGAYAEAVGCTTHPRDCGRCDVATECPVKAYEPRRRT